MYSPKFNQVADRSILIEAMQAYSFAILFGPQGESLIATHLPLVVKDEGEHGLIEGHFAHANPHWKTLANREVLVVFPGPHSYVSPTNYVEQLSVPSWNYIAVHAYGTLELVEDNAGKEALLAGLIQANEPAFARIPIARIEGKFKISQNRAPQERINVQATHAAGSDDQRALAAWMARLIK
ncbi:MAG: FMN-binding negative transcriptional regulator [Terracidiphilus sp.]